jgi:hypothetical protein
LTFEDIQLAGVPYKQSTLHGNAGAMFFKIDVVFFRKKIVPDVPLLNR